MITLAALGMKALANLAAINWFVDFDLSFLGWPHTAACLVAMAAFFPVMFRRKGGAVHRTWGRVYAVAYATLCVTSLGIYRLHKFWFPHWTAVGGLAVLVLGYLAAHYKPRGWRYIHLTAMLLSAFNLYGGAVNEAFLRIKFLRTMAGENLFASPVVGAIQSVVGEVFITLIVVYVVLTAVRSPRRARNAIIEEQS